MADIKQIHAQVIGRVQGVSFRYYTLKKAQELNLTGWVRNRSDASVEVLAQGEPDALDELKSFLHQGSPSAQVEQVLITEPEINETFSRFEVRY
ncbi:acylphosphatase [Anaerolineales bacterium]